MEYTPILPTLERWRPEDQKFKVILFYEFEACKWDAYNPVSKKQKKQKNLKSIDHTNNPNTQKAEVEGLLEFKSQKKNEDNVKIYF